jgi:cation transport ATPase
MNQQNNQPGNNENQPQYYDRRAARRQRIAERRAMRSGGGSWILGAVLILVGIFFLLQEYTSFELQNWWAFFILIPAVGAFGNAWRVYRNGGRLSMPARASLISGFLLTMVAAIFLLNLDWGILGPVLLILAGIGVLVNVVLPG